MCLNTQYLTSCWGTKLRVLGACFEVCKKNILNIIFTHWAVEKKNSACTLDTAQLCSSFIVVYQIFVNNTKIQKTRIKFYFLSNHIYWHYVSSSYRITDIQGEEIYIYIFICVAVTLNKIVIQVFHINVKRNSTFFTKLREIHTIKTNNTTFWCAAICKHNRQRT